MAGSLLPATLFSERHWNACVAAFAVNEPMIDCTCPR